MATYLKKNYQSNVQTEHTDLTPEQVERIGAAGSIVIVRGGNLFVE